MHRPRLTSPRKRRVRLSVEQLEDRCVPSAGNNDLPSLPTNPASYAPSDVLVRFDAGVNPSQVNLPKGTQIGQSLSLVPGLYTVDLSGKGANVSSEVQTLSKLPGVQYAQPDYVNTPASSSPNDPYYQNGSQWNLNGTYGINAPGAWSVTTGTPTASQAAPTVAVLDSGIDYTQPDLYQNIWINQADIPNSWYTKSSPTSGYDTLVYKSQIQTATPGVITFADLNNPANKGLVWDNNGNGYIDAGDLLAPISQGGWETGTVDPKTGLVNDIVGWDFGSGTNNPMYDPNAIDPMHATQVAGVLGAMTNNGVGVAGVDWQPQIMDVKVGGSNGLTTSAAISGLNYAVEAGAQIVNASWGGDGYNQAMFDAIAAAGQHNVLWVEAAGNGSFNLDSNPTYPQSYGLSNMIIVAGTDSSGNLGPQSNWGVNTVALAAPSVGIETTTPLAFNATGYASVSGTSFAAPEVAGVAALLWTEHPTWTVSQVKQQILSTVTPLASLSGLVQTGGELNAAAAVANPAPKVTATTPAASTYYASVSTAQITFSEPVSGVSAANFTLTTPSGGTVAATSVSSADGTGTDSVWNVVFPTQTSAGSYKLNINGSGIVDQAGNALTAPAPTTFSVAAQRTYSNTTPLTIYDKAKSGKTYTEKSSITVPDNLTLAQLSVQVNITEPADSNLYVYLVGPDGTKVTLLNPGSVSAGGSGATGSNFTNTTFSDTASSTISGGKGPYSGVYKPYQALSAFKGKSGKGTWTLYIVDEVAGGGNGKLNSWSLLETPSSL